MKLPTRLKTYCHPQIIALTAFFLAVFYYLWFVITYGLTDVCVYNEQFFRRFGYFLSWLDLPGSTSLANFFHKIRKFSELAMVSGGTHSNGALQFILWNLYLSGVVRDFFPIIPKVTAFGMQFIPACLAVVYAWLLGQRLESRRFAYIFAAAFILSPVMRPIARWDTIYTLLMVLTHLMVFYHWTAFVQDPERPFNRLMAPLSLGIYLTTGMDWPSTCFFLAFYLLLCKKLKSALSNLYMIIPAVIFGIQIMFFLSLYLVDANRTYGFQRWKGLLVIAAFKKLFVDDAFIAASKMTPAILGNFLHRGYGIGWFVAFVVALVVVFLAAKKVLAEPAATLETRRSFQIVMSCWLLLLSFPVLKTALYWGYTVISFSLLFPVAFLASLAVARETRLAVWDWAKTAVFLGCMVIPLGANSFFDSDIKLMDAFKEDHRLYAVADYMISARPDLLTSDKRALLPNIDGDVNPFNPDFLRFMTAGRYEYINPTLHAVIRDNMPEWIFTFPQSNGGEKDSALQHINWLILSTEGVTPIPDDDRWSRNAKFYENLLHDPRVDWIGRFVNVNGAKGKEMWLGEVRLDNVGKNRDVDHAPALEVEPLARMYHEKYNRVSFLKRNIDHEIKTW